MLTQDQFRQYCHQLGLSETARTVLNNIRTSPPVRRVRSSAKNVTVRYPSRKMGMVIQAESHRNELAFVYEMEYDDEVLEYYDQPSVIKLDYQAKNGRKVGVLHTPDFFVLRTDRAGWEECKTEVVIPETMSEERVGGFQPAKVAVNASVHWDGKPWTIVNVGEAEIWLQSAERNIIKMSPVEFKILSEMRRTAAGLRPNDVLLGIGNDHPPPRRPPL